MIEKAGKRPIDNLWTPDKERWPNKGWQGYDLTTAGNLLRPHETFDHVNQFNNGKSAEKRMGLEVYTTVDRFGLGFPIPTMDTRNVSSLQDKYPDALVTRVHPPFSYNLHELLTRPFIGERGNGWEQQLYNIAWIPFFGAATNMRFAKLVGDLNRNGQDVSVNMHTNVIEGFRKAGRLAEVKEKMEYADLLAENERKYQSPILENLEEASDPLTIKRRFIDGYDEVTGLLFGYDHGDNQGYDMVALLDNDEIQDTIKVVHLANTHKELEDGKATGKQATIQVGDERIGRFLRKLAQTPTRYPVRIAFDYSPRDFGKLPVDAQFQLLMTTIEWMNEIRDGQDAGPRILQFRRKPERGIIYAAA